MRQEKQEMHTDFGGKPVGKWLLGRSRKIWEDNITMDIRKRGCEKLT
jgi:hypothetical protein